MSKPVTVGMIGCGTIGRFHADAIVKTSAMEIVALCDPSQTPLDKAAAKYGCEALFTDSADLLAKSDCDAVMVCTPNTTHHEVAIAALQAGKHVFCEKPMSTTVEKAAAMAAAADAAPGVFQMGMVRRNSPMSVAAKRILDAGRIGEVYQMRMLWIRRRGIPGLGGWFTTKVLSGGGPMIDLGVHGFDLAMHLSDLWTPTRVSAKTYAKFGPRMGGYVYTDMWAGPPKLDGVFDVEDYSCGFVRFGERATMSFEIAWAANHRETQYLEILGDKGGMRLSEDGKITLLTEADGGLVDATYDYPETQHEGNFAWMFERQAERFAAACRGEQPSAATATEGLMVMKLLDAIYRSSDTNREVTL